MRVYKILKNTKVEGPGIRYCIWFQGCSRHCKGCWAKATWDKNGGKKIDEKELLLDILSTPNIEGVTFLGGEPFEQPEALEFLSKGIKDAGLSVLCFTGNNINTVKKKYPNIIKNIDLLIDGEFVEEQKDYSRPWVGSKNQGYHFLTDVYNEEILQEYHNKIEINVQKNGIVFVNGMGDFDKITENFGMFSIH